MFVIEVKEDRQRKPESDLRLEAANVVAAKHLRKVVTLPADPVNPTISFRDVESGGWLPPVSCAFRGCRWSGGGAVPEAAYRDDCEHPWDQQLKVHVQTDHGDTICTSVQHLVGKGQACDNTWPLGPCILKRCRSRSAKASQRSATPSNAEPSSARPWYTLMHASEV